MSAATLAPTALRLRLESRTPPTVLDVRTPAEFETGHIAGARNVPLDVLRGRLDDVAARLDGEVVYVCRSGQRAAQAHTLLAGVGVTDGAVLRGGLSEWESSGFDVDRGAQRWELERQVRLVAGSIVLTSVLGSVAVPKLKWVAAAIGGGLTFAAVSNTCAMATALSKLPYNRGPRYDESRFVTQLGA